jgi:hypothetical protein
MTGITTYRLKRDITDIKPDIKEPEVTLRNEIKQLDLTLRGEIKQLDVKIEKIRSDLTRDLKDLKYRMTIKLGTMMVVAVAAMATLVVLQSMRALLAAVR